MITTTYRPLEGPAPQPTGCVNLKQRFGEQYRVEYEESYYAERGKNGRAEDPWLMILLCKHGNICPWGGTQLAACTRRRGQIVNRLKALQFTTVTQDGEDGANVLFDVEHFDLVAEIMRPRRRRRMSEERRQEAAERLREYQPAKGQSVLDVVRQRAESTLESPFATPPV